MVNKNILKYIYFKRITIESKIWNKPHQNKLSCVCFEITWYIAVKNSVASFRILQVRKDQQILRARGDRLWMTIRDLQKGLDELKTEQGATQHQMNQIFRKVKSQTEPSFKGKTQLDLSTMRVRKR